MQQTTCRKSQPTAIGIGSRYGLISYVDFRVWHVGSGIWRIAGIMKHKLQTLNGMQCRRLFKKLVILTLYR